MAPRPIVLALTLDEIADVDVVVERSAGSQPRDRGRCGIRAPIVASSRCENALDPGAARRPSRCAARNSGATTTSSPSTTVALEHAADVDPHVAAAAEACRARRCAQDRPCARPARISALRHARLHDALDRRELRAIVDAQHVVSSCRRCTPRPRALGHRQRDDVGQVVLALRIVVAQRRRPSAAAARSGAASDAGVDLVDRPLARRRVLLLDDRAHGARRHRARRGPVRRGRRRARSGARDGRRPRARRAPQRSPTGISGQSPFATSVTPSSGNAASATRTASPVPRGGSCVTNVTSGAATSARTISPP